MDNKYQLVDYFELLKERFGEKCDIDLLTNKLGQATVRLRYKINSIKTFELFIFESGFAVSYKPNKRTKLYEKITPKQAAQTVKMVIDWYDHD